ncbi:TIR domain-containing protein [Geobacter sp. AOG2]|uniref:TIR domain-containing protein n=1 Tax=Geobacter sp. AOG2 TaxID=1566347 RepID=UPI001CC7AD10|nr:TIR domain-containing protein [Geobacter sp. AOG2]GFE59581.1 hypothetical protein AOG2_01690 [Geobacter sp. AOG2]
MNQTRNVFISHHHKDDKHVDSLTDLLANNGCNIRNSSIRAKPANQERLDKGLVEDSTIRRLLRMKMSWAGTVIVLIGKETHERKWVNWEITEAVKQGKNIVGVYEQGLKDKPDIPEALSALGTSIVEWNPKSIIDAINGITSFQNPDGSPSPRKDGAHVRCA